MSEMENPITGIGEEGKLKCRKQKKKSTNWAGKASWNPQNHQNSQPRQGKDKLKLSKSSKRSTEARKRQAEMSKIEKKVNEVAGKTS